MSKWLKEHPTATDSEKQHRIQTLESMPWPENKIPLNGDKSKKQWIEMADHPQKPAGRYKPCNKCKIWISGTGGSKCPKCGQKVEKAEKSTPTSRKPKTQEEIDEANKLEETVNANKKHFIGALRALKFNADIQTSFYSTTITETVPEEIKALNIAFSPNAKTPYYADGVISMSLKSYLEGLEIKAK